MLPALASARFMRLLEDDCSKDELTANLFESSQVGTAILDKNFRFRAINRVLAAINGLPVEAHKGKTIYQVLGNFADTVAPIFSRVLESQNPVFGIEVSGKRPRRSQIARWVETVIPLTDSDGKLSEIGVFVLEIRADATLRLPSPQLPDDYRRRIDIVVTGNSRFRPYVAPAELSARSLQIVRLLAEGKSNKQVACLLGISIKTVETHRARVMARLHLHSVVDLVHYAFRHGLVVPRLY